MRIILNEQGFVEAYALIGDFGTPSTIVDEPENVEDFEENYRSYYLSEDGQLMKNEDKQKEIEDKHALADLRSQREKYCFAYINRGEPWYSRLSAAQKEELDAWYQEWLDVTETKVIPESPEWLI